MEIKKIKYENEQRLGYTMWDHDPVLSETINQMICEIEKLDQAFECFASYSVFNDKVNLRQDEALKQLKQWISVHKEVTGGQHIHFENLENRLLAIEDHLEMIETEDPMLQLGKTVLKAVSKNYCEKNIKKIETGPSGTIIVSLREGTFEWALGQIREGHYVRRKDWDWKCCLSQGGGASFVTDIDDLLANDWVIEENYA